MTGRQKLLLARQQRQLLFPGQYEHMTRRQKLLLARQQLQLLFPRRRRLLLLSGQQNSADAAYCVDLTQDDAMPADCELKEDDAMIVSSKTPLQIIQDKFNNIPSDKFVDLSKQ